MAAGRDAGRLAGLAVSLGIGLAIVSGSGEAAADPADSPPSSDAAATGSQDSARTSERSSTDQRRAEAEKSTDASSETETEADTDTDTDTEADTAVADRSSRRDTVPLSQRRDRSDLAEYTSQIDTDTPAADGDGSPAPVEAQAVATMVAAARRHTHDEAGETIGPVASNPSTAEHDSTVTRQVTAAATRTDAPPAISAAVGAADPLSGVTRVTAAAVDPESEALTYTASRPSLGRVVGDGTGEFTYTPTTFVRVLARFLPFLTSDRFTITATDVHGGTASVRVTTTIVPINSAPRAGTATISSPAAETGVVTGRARATDPNRDSLRYLAATTATGKGSVTIHGDGGFVYTPTAQARHRAAAITATGADKTDRFTVTVSDKFGAVTDIAITVAISPVNAAPTGTVRVEAPDPASGVVSGAVSGLDADGDLLSYHGPSATLKGSVAVRPDGTFTYTPSATARYHAAHTHALPYDTSDSFRVTVDDGHGGSAVLAVRVSISPDGNPSAAPPLTTFCGCTLMPADTIFRADLRGLEAMPESDTWIGLLGGDRGATLRAAWAGNEWMGSTGGIPVNVVSADHPKEDVVFNRGYSTTGPGIDDRPYAIPDRPLVEGMPSVPAWDRHLLVFQEGTCISQELYNVANGVELPAAGILDALGNAAYAAIWGSAWIAEAGAQYDMSSPLYPAIGHANASRLPYLPMILRPDDLQRGYIDHMLGITIAKDVGAGYVWPARAGDGSAADGIPMGTVLRLRSDVDISQYAESTQVILRALQVHGAVVFDSKGPGTDGASLLAMSNGWAGTDYVTAKRELNTIAINLFEAVDAAGLALDAASGWQIR